MMITGVYDNDGRTFDRYTVCFKDGSRLYVGPTGNVPNGVCMWGDDNATPDGKILSFYRLPEAVQRAACNAARDLDRYAEEHRTWQLAHHS